MGTDPWDNLAAEEALFDRHQPGELTFLTYVNSACVVLGKNQNPWREINFSGLRGAGLPFLRRVTGGGTVYHDSGNLNFSFILDKSVYNKEVIHGFMARTMANWGLPLEVTEKGDYLFQGKKVSGNAMAIRRDRVLHHATLLVDADLERLRGVLGGLSGLDLAPGVKSRPMPVVNLAKARTDVTLDGLRDLLVSEFCAAAGAAEETWRVSGGQLVQCYDGCAEGETEAFETLFARHRERLHAPDWLWGETPDFTWSTSTRRSPVEVRVEAGRPVSFVREGRETLIPAGEGPEFFSPETIFAYIETRGEY